MNSQSKHHYFSFFKDLSKKDRAIFLICFFIGTTCSLLLTPYFDGSLDFLVAENSDQPIIGTITQKTNDIQIKQHQQLIWLKAKQNQNVRTGDSVFSGEKSYTQIQVNNSNKIVLGENSLILFQEIDSQKVANLKDGNFRITVNGNIKVAIDGKLAEIQGDKSEIQVYLSEDKTPKIKLLSGNASVTDNNGSTQTLVEGAVALFKPEEPPKTVEAPPTLQNDNLKLSYKWKLYDLYSRTEDNTLAANPLPEQVNYVKLLKWSTNPENKEMLVEIAGQMDFSNKKSFKAELNQLQLEQIFVGKNFWRVKSASSNEWSTIADFELSTDFTAVPSLSSVTYSKNIPLLNSQAQGRIAFKSNNDVVAYVVESSEDSEFKTDNIKINFVTDNQLNLSFNKAATIFYRIRSVNQNQEISNWSNTFKIEVFSPNPPKAPILANSKTQVYLSQEAFAEWQSEDEKVFIEIRTENNQLIKSFSDRKFKTKLPYPGTYTATAYSVDKYGQTSPPADSIQIKVQEDPLVLAASDDKTDESLKQPVEKKSGVFFNDAYKESKLSFNLFTINLFSSQQLANNNQNPTITGAGASVTQWYDQHGVEANLKSGLSSSNGNSKSVLSLEALYKYRFLSSYSNSFTRELQFTLISGYEMYRNPSTASLFSPKYDILKVGAGLSLPIHENWSANGQILLGLGLDGSIKLDAGGEGLYYLSRAWSLGMGYRISLFQAGSASTSGNGVVPYREGYTQIYTLLNFNY